MIFNIKWIATIFTLVALNGVYLPILTYYLFKFRSKRNQMVIRKRYPYIVTIMAYLGLLYISVSRWFALIPKAMIETQVCFDESNKCSIAKFVFYWISVPVYSISIIGTPMYLYLKYFLIYFEIKWMQQSFNFHWKIFISNDNNDFDIPKIPIVSNIPFFLSY